MRLYSDNAKAFFGGDINNSALVFTVASGMGALFPSPTGTDYFIATFESADRTKMEKVTVTARNSDSFSIASGGRAQEGTSAQSWTTSDYVSVRWTASSSLFFTRGVQFNAYNYKIDTGTSTAYAVVLDPPPVAYAAGLKVIFKAANQNTGPSTINCNGLGAVSLKKFVTLDLSPGDILVNELIEATHDGINFQITNFTKPRPGTITLYVGASAPTGWYLCDGGAISRTTNSVLFGVIGTVFGAGNGTTTFNVPDLRGRTPIGAGQGAGLTNRPLASTGGEENHILTIPEMPRHNHTYQLLVPGADLQVQSSGYNNNFTLSDTGTFQTGGDGSHNTMQPFMAINYIIKA